MTVSYFFLLGALSASLGVMEAVLWSGKSYDAFKFNEHVIFTVSRILIFSSIFAAPYIDNLLLVLCAGFLSFPFFHDGAYYVTRGMIDVPGYNFFSDSNNSSAVIEIKFKYRLAFFILSVFILCYFSL